MSPVRIAALLCATLLTALAAIARIDNWADAAHFLQTAAIGSWIIYAILTGTDRILDDLKTLRTSVEDYGNNRHADGVIDGMNRAVPQQPTIQRIR